MVQEIKKIRRTLKGIVTSVKMKNTVVVRVDRVKVHPRYGKRYTVSRKYSCDYRGQGIIEGSMVAIEECAPVSKTKKFRIIEKI